MSERSRNLPRRSCLSVPGSSEKMMGKAPNLGADMVFLDLEDAVAPLEKEASRDKVVKAINDLDWGDTVLCVRVNAWDTKWTYRDVIHVAENSSERLDEIMLPKVQSAADVQALDMLLTQIEETTGRKSTVGVQVIDGPYLKIRDLDGLREYSMRPRILGYDGKWALHPDQVAVINEIFTPTQEQFDHAVDLLEAYEKATTEGGAGERKGAVMFGDEMIDEASRKMATKFLRRGERAGMTRTAKGG